MFQYMSSTLAIPRHEYYGLHVYFSTLAKRLAVNTHLWEMPADTTPDAKMFGEAIRRCIANCPARIEPAPVIDTVSIVDACVTGFAALTCHLHSGGGIHVELLQHRWTPHEVASLQLHHSTRSEPEGLARTARNARERLGPRAAQLMLTDHEGFALAYSHDASLDPYYNTRVQRLRTYAVDATIYTPGDTNLADKYSRFKVIGLTEEDRAAARAVAAQYLGRTVGQAYRMVGGDWKRAGEPRDVDPRGR